jgi:hypothetical protein
MTAATFIVPYQRGSAINIPRRDLMIGAADSLLVRVTIVHSDDPSAAALDITGGINGPTLRFMIWADWANQCGYGWTDYGRGTSRHGDLLWAGTGVAADAVGSFDVTMPAGSISGWPVRCGFSVQLDWDAAIQSELLCQGRLHILRGWSSTPQVIPVLTDPAGSEILLA